MIRHQNRWADTDGSTIAALSHDVVRQDDIQDRRQHTGLIATIVAQAAPMGYAVCTGFQES